MGLRNFARTFLSDVRYLFRQPDEPGRSLAEHVLALADDAYLAGHPEWREIVREAVGVLNIDRSWDECQICGEPVRHAPGPRNPQPYYCLRHRHLMPRKREFA